MGCSQKCYENRGYNVFLGLSSISSGNEVWDDNQISNVQSRSQL